MEEWNYINNYLLCDANNILDNSMNTAPVELQDLQPKVLYVSPK